MENTTQQVQQQTAPPVAEKFCKFCGEKISADAIICTKCGRQVEELKTADAGTPSVVIQNTNVNTLQNTAVPRSAPRNKWVAFFLCLFLGAFGIHKFYEGKIGMGILYLLSLGLAGIGVLIDLIVLLTKPNPYYPRG